MKLGPFRNKLHLRALPKLMFRYSATWFSFSISGLEGASGFGVTGLTLGGVSPPLQSEHLKTPNS